MRSAARLALRRHWRGTWPPQIQAAEAACASRGALFSQLQGDATVQHAAAASWRPSGQRRWQHSAPAAKDPSVCWNVRPTLLFVALPPSVVPVKCHSAL